MVQTSDAAVGEEVNRILARFERNGAKRITTDLLQPADSLLDLYGEDIRARAYVTEDPVRGELMLRPDFTLPVANFHMATGIERAEYTYAGPVFRRQWPGVNRSSEFIQVGLENFGNSDIADADAEVYATFAEIMSGSGFQAITGDIGILIAAVESLSTTSERKAALRRHIWRPLRFMRLLDKFCWGEPDPRVAWNVASDHGRDFEEVLIANAGPMIGRRGADEIRERLEVLERESKTDPLSPKQSYAIKRILGLKGKLWSVIPKLRKIQESLPQIESAVDLMEDRVFSMRKHGIDGPGLYFTASFGRTTLEYYDGFVFGFLPRGAGDAPVAASGGRYDLLTRMLGGGKSVPAVGGVIRPEISAVHNGPG